VNRVAPRPLPRRFEVKQMKDYVDVFKASYQRAIGNTGYDPDFIGKFYEIFIGESDQIGARFANTNMSTQKTMLHDSLHYMVDFFLSRKTSEYLQRIARVHSQHEQDIPPALYDIWLDSLIKALEEFDTEFDEEVELAWRLVAPGIVYMKFMHARCP
jgi:hemoglobin-like flavoprotein